MQLFLCKCLIFIPLLLIMNTAAVNQGVFPSSEACRLAEESCRLPLGGLCEQASYSDLQCFGLQADQTSGSSRIMQTALQSIDS